MSGCREWQGARTTAGYGERHVAGSGQHGATEYVHRWVWEQINGPIPKGQVVMHLCDNPACFRYDHLAAGTQGDNLRDMMRKGRGRRQFTTPDVCKNGHPLVGPDADVYVWHGHRHCRPCRRKGVGS